eukprot:TRINITY_DN16708_c0_g1_i2.p1 TRINITY_DN16708_c0_g1~~TRINITY_DN16708_c0_g1_i2.p1  ORF type:complete len:566 (-),score=75.26 TRINITY_DN16708_c0_g1_i2:161-1654(-)
MARMLRLGRIVRVARLFRSIPELYKLVAGFVTTVKAIFWGFIVMILLLCMFAILTISVVQPYRDKESEDWCSLAFSSVALTVLYFFQTLIAGDAWGVCATPYILAAPELFFVFSSSLCLITLGFTNLMLSVIVDASTEAREKDAAIKAEERLEEQRQAMEEFRDMLKQVDEDGDGVITRDEIEIAYENNVGDLREKLASFGLDQTELNQLLGYVDMDSAGDVDYAEFMHSLIRGRHSDDRTFLFSMKIQLDFICHVLKRHLVPQSVRSEPAEGFMKESELQPPTEKEICSSTSVPCSQVDNQASPPFSKVWPATQGASSLQGDLLLMSIQMKAQVASLSTSLDAQLAMLEEQTKSLAATKDMMHNSTSSLLRHVLTCKAAETSSQAGLHRITPELEEKLTSLRSSVCPHVGKLADQSSTTGTSTQCPTSSCFSSISMTPEMPEEKASMPGNGHNPGLQQQDKPPENWPYQDCNDKCLSVNSALSTLHQHDKPGSLCL